MTVERASVAYGTPWDRDGARFVRYRVPAGSADFAVIQARIYALRDRYSPIIAVEVIETGDGYTWLVELRIDRASLPRIR